MSNKLKNMLNEAETLAQAIDKDQIDPATAAKADAQLDDPKVISNKGQIESELDRALKVNRREIKRGGRNFLNLLFVGEAGSGKTARISAWAKANNINLVKVLASTMDDTDLGGAIAPSADNSVVNRLASTEFDELANVPDSVLFLDEYNRAPSSVRGTLLTLIQDHTIRDDRVADKARFLPNFLFTVAAVNPANNDYNTDVLDDAEMSRFGRIQVNPDPNNTRQYLTKLFDRYIQEAEDNEERAEYVGKKALADALLGSKDFRFDNQQDIDKSKEHGNGLILSARTLTNLLNYCDGTKESFLNAWNRFCNSTQKPNAERILSKYVDVQDKANAALAGGTDSYMFQFKQAEKNAWQKYQDYVNNNY